MSEWKEVRLGEWMQFNPSRTIKKGHMARKIPMDSLVPYSKTIDKYYYEPYKGGAKFQNGDTIMARITPCLENGKHAFISLLDQNETAFGSTEYIVMCGIEGISDNDFVYYLTHTPFFKNHAIKSMVGSSGRQRAQVDVLQNLIMLVPTSLIEQRRIAAFLSSLDSKIENNRKICANLEAQAQALFKHWFIDFAPFKDGKFVESELGMIPEGWRVGTFTEIFNLCPGGTPKTSESSYWENGNIPFFSPKDVTGIYCFKTEKQITKEGLNNCSSRLYDTNTVLITCRGTVGKVTMSAVPMAMNQSNYAILAKEGYSQYYAYLMTVAIVRKLKFKAVGSVFDAITSKDFNEKIIIPDFATLKSFDSLISTFFEEIKAKGFESSRLSTLRDTLLPKLMSGEIKV